MPQTSTETLVNPVLATPPVPAVVSRKAYLREASQSPAPSTFSHNVSERDRSRSTSRGGSKVRLLRDSLRGVDSTKWESPDEKENQIPKIPFRSRLHPFIAHFLGSRTPSHVIRPLKVLGPVYESYVIQWLGGFISILLICAIAQGLAMGGFGQSSLPLAIGSMGATAVLIYGMPQSPLSTPRHVMGGHMISALIGVVISELFSLSPNYSGTYNDGNAGGLSFSYLTPLAGALAVATSIVVMTATGTVHPPGGATALIASVQANAIKIHFSYLLLVLLTTSTMTFWGLMINNLSPKAYPAFWWTASPPPSPSAPPTVVVAPPKQESVSPDRVQNLGKVEEEIELERRHEAEIVDERGRSNIVGRGRN